MPRDPAVVIHERFLQFGDLFFVDTAGGEIVPDGKSGSRTGSLTEDGTGAHDTGGTHCHVGGGDVSAGKEQVVDVLRVERPVGDPVGLRSGVEDGGSAGVVERRRVVVVHGPAAVADHVVKLALFFHIVLGQHMIADVPDIFPFAGEHADPFDLEIFGDAFTAVLGQIPDAEDDLRQFVPDLFCVSDRILFPAGLHPPEVVAGGNGAVVPLFLEHMRKGQGFKGFMHVGVFSLDQDGVPHGLVVCHFGSVTFVVLASGFPSGAEFGTGDPENGVTGAVRKEFCIDRVLFLRRQLPGIDRLDTGAVHFHAVAGTVQQQGQVFLTLNKVDEDVVPDIVLAGGIVPHIFQLDLFQNTGFFQVDPHCAADPHADLTGGVPSEHGAILHQNRFCTVPCRGNSRADTCHTAADHAEVGIDRHLLKRFHVHCC